MVWIIVLPVLGKIYPNKKEMNNLLETRWGTLLHYVQVIHFNTIQYFWDNFKNKKWKQNKRSMESWSSILFIVKCSV